MPRSTRTSSFPQCLALALAALSPAACGSSDESSSPSDTGSEDSECKRLCDPVKNACPGADCAGVCDFYRNTAMRDGCLPELELWYGCLSETALECSRWTVQCAEVWNRHVLCSDRALNCTRQPASDAACASSADHTLAYLCDTQSPEDLGCLPAALPADDRAAATLCCRPTR